MQKFYRANNSNFICAKFRRPYALAGEERTAVSGTAERNAKRAWPYFAVGSLFTLLSMNSRKKLCGSRMKNERVVGPMNTGTSDLLSV
jgi:hypothetical protein